MVSIKDVAHAAGVSPQTVSNSINNPSIVKAATRMRVAAAIDKLGYTPNASARRLRTRRSNTIAIGIAPVSRSRVYDRLLHALALEADKHDIRVLLYKIDSNQDEIRQFDNLTSGADVDAFVLTDTAHDDPRIPWLIEHRQPFVLFGRPWGVQDCDDIAWVDIDGRKGIAQMTQHLILHGRKRIGFIGWPEPSGTGTDRRLGWEETMLQAHMATEDELAELSCQAQDSIADGKQACKTLLARRPDIDAIACVSDTIATGAIMALDHANDVIVTGFDNTASAQSLNFPTIDQPLGESAEHIVRIIREQIHDRGESHGTAGDHVLLAPTLVLHSRTQASQE